MAHRVKVIERNRIIGGYTLSVRDDWVFKIKKVHLEDIKRVAKKYLNNNYTMAVIQQK